MNVLKFLAKKSGDRHYSNTELIDSSLFPKHNQAVVDADINPDSQGRIYYQSTYWFACSLHDIYIPEGTVVEVLERRGNTWLVTPAAYSPYQRTAYQLTELN
ncbi:MAG: NfeD family protein [Elainellaceae cyanobacterium]